MMFIVVLLIIFIILSSYKIGYDEGRKREKLEAAARLEIWEADLEAARKMGIHE